MYNQTFSWKKFNENPIVGIVRGMNTPKVLDIIPTYLDSGFFTLEITMNSPNVLETIKTIADSFPELNLGAGTVCNMDDLKKALDVGSQFIVTPIIDERVIKHCVANKIPIFPGGYTPTEIYKAWNLGADAVKIFPATQLGLQFIKDIQGPLSEIKLLPTGGVSKDNIDDFFQLGCVGVGMGSSLFDKQIIEKGDKKELEKHFNQIKNASKKK
ncbi:bifunctional 4-hydroxy-2-oxoglutarate aldolase/2-dehydro-3-deoxy-phosphogluconate aldolase [Aquimarina algiphila]|uniref:bifunctional 4-hydroxy-2-oxoglutarate aldolase/2-dehydro-3-deoxy-phosphogluconate aldolase n=1 Tax=Aquimarina algiphila TaxID=2047982 RepID=UPI00248FF31D|nr:bifunctional 4-hydroxy-2-oxoglutarate aldolase/2-dehydro-3-deoxy-phosphogluconate aldolase [Aquimarina algiphila]